MKPILKLATILNTGLPGNLSLDFSTMGDGAVPGLIGSTWAIIGGKAVNTPTVGSELLTNGDMEAGSPPTGWTGYQSTRTSDASIFHGGAKSLKNVATNTNSSSYQTAAMSTSEWYIIDGWMYADGTNLSYMQVIQVASPYTIMISKSLSASTWTRVMGTFRAIDTSNNVRGWTNILGSIFYMDDFSLKKFSLPALFSYRMFSTQYGICKAAWNIVAGTPAGVYMCMDNPANPTNMVTCLHDGTNVKLSKRVNGTVTDLISTATTYVAGANVEIRRAAGTNTFQAFYNNSQVGTDQTISDATIIANRYHGMFSTHVQNTANSFSFTGA
jgi:hypothetical protein